MENIIRNATPTMYAKLGGSHLIVEIPEISMMLVALRRSSSHEWTIINGDQSATVSAEWTEEDIRKTLISQARIKLRNALALLS